MVKKLTPMVFAGLFALGLGFVSAVPASQAADSSYLQTGAVDLGDIAVRRIGNAGHEFIEYQDRAMENALVILAELGVPRSSINAITVDTRGGDGGNGNLVPTGGYGSVKFRLWVQVDDCPKSIYFSARRSGTIETYQDRAACVAA